MRQNEEDEDGERKKEERIVKRGMPEYVWKFLSLRGHTTRVSYTGDKTQEEGIPDRYVRYYVITSPFLSLK